MKKQIRVLIGDDGTIFSVSCANALRTQGFWAYTRAQSNAVILDSIKKERPDVIVVDLSLPTMDFLALLCGPARELGIMFLAVSAVENSMLEQQMLQNGANAFLRKTADAGALARDIMTYAKGLVAEPSTTEDLRYHIEVTLTNLMHRFGVPAHVRGYYFMREAIMMTVDDPELLQSVTKELYPSVAETFHTTASRVERSIRHAIELSWERGAVDVLNDYFGATICNLRGRPTNSEFIAMVSDKLRLEFCCVDHRNGSKEP